jgi:hypothetical protein
VGVRKIMLHFVVKGNLTAYFVVLIPSEAMIPAMRLVSSSMNFL